MTFTHEEVFGGERPTPEPGPYRARLISVMTKNSKKTGAPYRLWTFKVDGAEILVSGFTSIELFKQSKAYQWATTLLGHEPKPGQGLDTLLGQPATIITQLRDTFLNVTDVKPWPEGRNDAQIIADEPLSF